jgi:hypothetical protein
MGEAGNKYLAPPAKAGRGEGGPFDFIPKAPRRASRLGFLGGVGLGCANCGHAKVTRPRGLCWVCYRKPEVKACFGVKVGEPQRAKPERPRCWACGGTAHSTNDAWAYGWVSRRVELPGGIVDTELYCRPCFNVWSWPV